MKRTLILPSLLGAVAVACATAPDNPRPASSRDCPQLAGEIAAVEAERRAAQAKKDGAWKAIVPFAVAGRLASASAAAGAADQRLAALHHEAAQRGCDREAA